MQPTAREMQAMAAAGQISLDDLRAAIGAGGVHDEFLDQLLGGLPPSAWADLPGGKAPEGEGMQQQFGGLYDESAMLASRLRQHQISGGGGGGGAEAAKQMVMQQLTDLRQGHHHHHMMLQGMGRSAAAAGGGDGGMHLPLSLGSGGGSGGADVQALLKAAANSAGGEAGGGVFGGSFAGSLQQQQQQHFQPHPQPQTAPMPTKGFGGGGGGGGGGASQQQPGPAGGGAPASPRQRVRARRGQATDPHSIAERLRRERIAERMKALQELVPNANKTDKATMLDEIIDYVKFLQLQVKVLSMSRLGGAAAVAPLVADMSSEVTCSFSLLSLATADGYCHTTVPRVPHREMTRLPFPGATTIHHQQLRLTPSIVHVQGRGGAAPAATSDVLTVTEQQVAKLMEEDMGTAMQYLQGKGLCLMPVSLASAISTATCHMRPPVAGPLPPGIGATAAHHMAAAAMRMNGGADAVPASPSMSVLTAQSAMANGAGGADGEASQQQPKDAASVSKP
ncbi:hypothetical protein PR202_gb22629 [Eleusine coracana subsp. coracana]|uniref:BHLH domain-containing protein n=1 Tax=Eleusine coracana subsp. coracana TaxID=191504 RepID=A0AAV5FH72_ELECO|nr:hypothetical protein PR202_gb22629 [Eleusine coracana subsp. coracana]